MRLTFRVEHWERDASPYPRAAWARLAPRGLYVTALGAEALIPRGQWDRARERVASGDADGWWAPYAGTEVADRMKGPLAAAAEAAVRALHLFTPPLLQLEQIESASGPALPPIGAHAIDDRRFVVVEPHGALGTSSPAAHELYRAGLLHRFSVCAPNRAEDAVFYRPPGIEPRKVTFTRAAWQLLESIDGVTYGARIVARRVHDDGPWQRVRTWARRVGAWTA